MPYPVHEEAPPLQLKFKINSSVSFSLQILEIVPEPSEKLPIGTRVCVYWSKSYNCLFPGTVEQDDYVPLREDMIQVVLDDGDRRQVDMRSVRLLPENYRQIGELSLFTLLSFRTVRFPQLSTRQSWPQP